MSAPSPGTRLRALIAPWPVALTAATRLPHPPAATVETVLQGGRLPYHTIISRGMMQRWEDEGRASPTARLGSDVQWWDTCAPLIEDAWNFWAAKPESRDAEDGVDLARVQARVHEACDRLATYLNSNQVGTPYIKPYASIPHVIYAMVIRAALDAGLRSFDQGLNAALDHLARDGGAMLGAYCERAAGWCPPTREIQQVEMAALKEGHTSSIIRVAVRHRGSKWPVLFGLNVARDLTDAAAELEANRRDLGRWSACDPDRVAAVYGSGNGRLLHFGREGRLPIVAVRWFDGAREVHIIPDPDAPGHGRCVLVGEFVPEAGPVPGIRGVLLDADASDRLWAEIVSTRTALAEIDWQHGMMEAPELELNDGDVVAELHDGLAAAAVRKPTVRNGCPLSGP